MKRTILAGVLIAFFSASAVAVDLGRHGPVYEIREPDFLEEMLAKARASVESGAWKNIEADAKRRAIARLDNPPPLAGIATASAGRSWLFDPSIVLSQALTDDRGQMLFPAGTRVNPLDTVSLSQPLLFFDGRDPAQVERAQTLFRRFDALTPILVAGSWQELGTRWQRRVFFDQGGALTGKLGIRAVPALVTQEGRALRVEEFAP